MDEDAQEPMDQLSAHLDRGWDLVGRGDLAGAMLSAHKSLEVDEDSPEAHNLAGYILAAEGRAEEALDHYRAALEIDESFVEVMLNAIELLIHPLGEHEEAERMIEDALEWVETDDERADAMLLKVDLHLTRGEKDAAARVARALPEGPFENAHLAFQVGRARFEVGDVEGAEPFIRLAAEQDPPDGEPHYYLGLLAERREDRPAAIAAFLESRERDGRVPKPPWALPTEQFERRVQAALARLHPVYARAVDGALVVVTDHPGVEVVAEGIDPRAGVLLDDLQPAEAPTRAGRVFVYQRNIERGAAGLFDVEAAVFGALMAELTETFPALVDEYIAQETSRSEA